MNRKEHILKVYNKDKKLELSLADIGRITNSSREYVRQVINQYVCSDEYQQTKQARTLIKERIRAGKVSETREITFSLKNNILKINKNKFYCIFYDGEFVNRYYSILTDEYAKFSKDNLTVIVNPAKRVINCVVSGIKKQISVQTLLSTGFNCKDKCFNVDTTVFSTVI